MEAVRFHLSVLRRARFVGLPAICLSASRYFGGKETLCLYWPLPTLVITVPKELDFHAGFCAHRATSLKSDGKDILSVTIVLNSEHSRADLVAFALGWVCAYLLAKSDGKLGGRQFATQILLEGLSTAHG